MNNEFETPQFDGLVQPVPVHPQLPNPYTNPELESTFDDATRAAALAALGLAKEQKHRRADWAVQPENMFMCANGHLQYNLQIDEVSEMRKRGEIPPPTCYEGGACRNCTQPIASLTADPKQLQYKLSTALMTVAQLQASLEPFRAVHVDYNKISMFLRDNYVWEIHEGQAQHDGNSSKAVMYYLKIERNRWRVTTGRLWRAFMRMVGA